MDDLCKPLDQGRSALLLLLDFAAVFNTDDHNLLVHHLTDVGVWGTAPFLHTYGEKARG